jgi:hypothetical protein
MDFISTEICQVWFISLKNLSDFVCFLLEFSQTKLKSPLKKKKEKSKIKSRMRENGILKLETVQPYLIRLNTFYTFYKHGHVPNYSVSSESSLILKPCKYIIPILPRQLKETKQTFQHLHEHLHELGYTSNLPCPCCGIS